jgi:hypothetical protein
LDFSAYDEMLAGKPDAGNPHVRFDEGVQRDWRKPPVALYSTVHSRLKILKLTGLGVSPQRVMVQVACCETQQARSAT